MKAKKMMFGLTVFAMLTAFVIGGTGNLFANDVQEQKRIELIDVLIADAKLSDTQKQKYADFRSSLNVQKPEAKQEKNMEFVNKLINVMSF